MSFEAAAISFAGVAFLWNVRESIATRDAVLKINTSLYGDRGLEQRVEALAKRMHAVEGQLVGVKLLLDARDE